MTSTLLRQVSSMRDDARTGRARERREAAQLSLREVARALKTSPSTLHRWETGASRPPAEAALRWARLLDGLTGAAK